MCELRIIDIVELMGWVYEWTQRIGSSKNIAIFLEEGGKLT